MTRLAKTNKYNAVKTTIDGITFDSKAEARRYVDLLLLKQAKSILWFQRQPSFLLPGGIRYRPDFIVCGINNIIWCEDVKGMTTPVFRMKQKLWAETYPTIELKVIK